MSDLVPAADIEDIVGVPRHDRIHYGRAVSAEQRVYILHPKCCLQSGRDPRHCRFSLALDDGIDVDTWDGFEDCVVALGVARSGRLVPSYRVEPDQ